MITSEYEYFAQFSGYHPADDFIDLRIYQDWIWQQLIYCWIRVPADLLDYHPRGLASIFPHWRG